VPFPEKCFWHLSGGSADCCIKFWNTHTGACLNTIDTHSQVCSLLWNKHERELLSSHGFSQNQLTLWKYPSMVKITELIGHTSRVFHLAEVFILLIYGQMDFVLTVFVFVLTVFPLFCIFRVQMGTLLHRLQEMRLSGFGKSLELLIP
jgi:hypothetical protein